MPGGREVLCIWNNMKKNHPIIYEVVCWGILVMALVSLIHDCI